MIMSNLKRYTIWTCLIVIFASYSTFLKSANDLIKEYQLAMSEIDKSLVRRAMAREPGTTQIEELEEETTEYTIKDITPLESEIEPNSVEDIIRDIFGNNADNMIKLFTCESGLESDKAGDLGLTFEHNGEILGSSHGIAQIRTGGNDNGIIWNRAEKNGMTVKQFIKKLEDPEYNLNYAKDIFDDRGYFGWYNCGVKEGLISK